MTMNSQESLSPVSETQQVGKIRTYTISNIVESFSDIVNESLMNGLSGNTIFSIENITGKDISYIVKKDVIIVSIKTDEKIRRIECRIGNHNPANIRLVAQGGDNISGLVLGVVDKQGQVQEVLKLINIK